MFLLVTIYPFTYPGNIKFENDEKKHGRKEQEGRAFGERRGMEMRSHTIYTLTS